MNYGTSNNPVTKSELDAQPGIANIPKPPPQWMALLDERTNKHIVFARTYAREFAHGAPGHLDLMTIAKLADMLDELDTR